MVEDIRYSRNEIAAFEKMARDYDLDFSEEKLQHYSTVFQLKLTPELLGRTLEQQGKYRGEYDACTEDGHEREEWIENVRLNPIKGDETSQAGKNGKFVIHSPRVRKELMKINYLQEENRIKRPAQTGPRLRDRRRIVRRKEATFVGWIREEIAEHPDKPFGIAGDLVDWQAFLGPDKSAVPGEYLTKYLRGMKAAEGVHPIALRATLTQCFFRHGQDQVIDLSPQKYEELVRERIEDRKLDFGDTIRFVIGLEDIRFTDMAKRMDIAQEDFVRLLRPEQYPASFQSSRIARLLDNQNILQFPSLPETSGPDPEIVRIIWAKARQSALDMQKSRPFLPGSDQQVDNILRGAQGAWDDYKSGGRLKSELPLFGDIMHALCFLSAENTSHASIKNWVKEKGCDIDAKRLREILASKISPTEKELIAFCNALSLAPDVAGLLQKLPSSPSSRLEYRHPEYVVAHPEHYETFGSWLKALRESNGSDMRQIGKIVGVAHETIRKAEIPKDDNAFSPHTGSEVSIIEKILATNPYGCFPMGGGEEAVAFRKKFLALAKPGVMGAQYREAQNWITQAALLENLPLSWDRALHEGVLKKMHTDAAGLREGEGDFTVGETRVTVRRAGNELDFHVSAIDKLRADPVIGEHMARQEQLRQQQNSR